jgi:hypothetical protein
MGGALAGCVAAGIKRIAVTVGSSGTLTGFLTGSFGSISPSTLTDNGGTARTINALDHDSGTNSLVFQLSGAIANSDATFRTMAVGGALYTRASATYTTPGGNATWTWTKSGTPYGSNTSVLFS